MATSSSSLVAPYTVEEWQSFISSINELPKNTNLLANNKSLLYLFDKYMKSKTFIVNHFMNEIDVMMFRAIQRFVVEETKCCEFPSSWRAVAPHVARWYSYVATHNGTVGGVGTNGAVGGAGSDNKGGNKLPMNTKCKEEKTSMKATDTSFEGKLVGAEMGKVVTRFPPEPSGYLHIGHAKAVLINNFYARRYNGKLIVRFDDTNPTKETMEFESSILEDINMLNVTPDEVTHTSDYFDVLIQLMETLINEGKMYVDDTPVEQMRYERGNGIESKSRSNSVEQNLKLWNEMKNGTAQGIQCCVRAKINMLDNNKCMRDPVMYRCNTTIDHYRWGDKYKVYPTYDFACPIVDSIEGVTHALRTNEYSDRIPQYYWVLNAANYRRVEIYEFSRLNFVRTILSKRRLKWLVENNVVEGWDDPRFPTVRGITRRGLMSDALLAFLLEQGPTKAGNLMEWDKLWAKNKQMLDPIVPRYMAVGEDAVTLSLSDGPSEAVIAKRNLHPKDESMGQTSITFYRDVLIDIDDAINCHEGEEVTLMRWQNAIIDKIYKSSDGEVQHLEGHLNPEGDFKKTKSKIHWLPKLDEELYKCVLVEYDHLLTVDKLEEDADWTPSINQNTEFKTNAFANKMLSTLKDGEFIQLERRGYFRFDGASTKSKGIPHFVKIPDGKAKSVSRISTKVNAAALAGKRVKNELQK